MKKEILLRLNNQTSMLLDKIVANSKFNRTDYIRELIKQDVLKNLLNKTEITKEVKLELMSDDLKILSEIAINDGLRDYEELIYSIIKNYIVENMLLNVTEEFIDFGENDYG